MNLLYLENSPYLLQHANNPVHWKPWSDVHLEEAKGQNKLILVSIGYAACHWCHVMEHDCFESDEVANVQNAYFVNIKIDREERPDIDAVYMKSLQMMNGQGGWPLNMVCLPDGRPIWGATYVKKEQWINVLTQLYELYTNQPEKVIEYASNLEKGIEIKQLALSDSKHNTLPWNQWLNQWSKSFDTTYGGYGRAPKFMMPTNLEFLMLYAIETQNQTFLNHVNLTLKRMACGGLFDVVEGGFSRYSVDIKWHVPHFEKMLYDNGLLLSIYAKYGLSAPNPLYNEVVDKTIAFMTSHWLTKEGLFYASWDADSLNNDGVLEEGAFYVWNIEELKNLLKSDFEKFSLVYNINDFGYWEHNNYVLIQNQTDESLAQQFEMTYKTFLEQKNEWLVNLKKHRAQRNYPRLDNKLITSWNAMTATGLLDAYMLNNQAQYLELAEKNIKFLIQNLWDGTTLFRIYNNGQCSINGFLEDYAFLIQALIKCFQINSEDELLNHAKNLTDQALDLFFDDDKKFFKYQSNALESWQIHYETEDNVIPSSNTIMAQNLRILGLLYFNTHYTKISDYMVDVITKQIDYPSAYSHWLIEQWYREHPPKELVIIGNDAQFQFEYFYKKYWSNTLVFYGDGSSNIPLLNRSQSNETMYYLCEKGSCIQPIRDREQLEKLLNS